MEGQQYMFYFCDFHASVREEVCTPGIQTEWKTGAPSGISCGIAVRMATSLDKQIFCYCRDEATQTLESKGGPALICFDNSAFDITSGL